MTELAARSARPYSWTSRLEPEHLSRKGRERESGQAPRASGPRSATGAARRVDVRRHGRGGRNSEERDVDHLAHALSLPPGQAALGAASVPGSTLNRIR